LAVLAENTERVLTPFGYRLKQCVMEFPSGSLIEEVEGGLRVTHDDYNGAQIFPVDPECMADMLATIPKRYLRDPNAITCTSLPCNDWCDNAGWMYQSSSQVPFHSFYANYTIPGEPPKRSSQVLFYFIGMENTNGNPRQGSNLAILQPVLTYGEGLYWGIKSWYCCPSGVTTSSPPITGLGPGDVLATSIVHTDSSNYEVVSAWPAHGKEVSLKCPQQGRIFNWADITLEVYSATSCSEFASGPMTFSGLNLTDATGKDITASIANQWVLSAQSPCTGVIKEVNPYTFTIQHSTV